MEELLKKCGKCKKIKPLTEFHKNAKSKDGRHGDCKECRATYWKRIYIPKPRGVSKREHEKHCRSLVPYDKEELLSRPIEHVLEVFDSKTLGQVWGISSDEAWKIKKEPWLNRLDSKHDPKCGEPKLTMEHRVKLRKYIEENM